MNNINVFSNVPVMRNITSETCKYLLHFHFPPLNLNYILNTINTKGIFPSTHKDVYVPVCHSMQLPENVT
jgi:hypothetical protein